MVATNNLLELSSHGPVQKGEKLESLPVDARSNVPDDLPAEEGGQERFDLALKVGPLLLARNPRVADFGLDRLLVDSAGIGGGPVADECPLDVAYLVEPLAIVPSKLDGRESTTLSPVAERVVAEAKLPTDGCGRDALVLGSIHKPHFAL